LDDDEVRRLQQPAVDMVQRLAADSPHLSAMVAEHLDDYGEMLTTILLADVARWFVRSVENRGADPGQYNEAKQVVNRLDSAFAAATGELENTIAVGFVETILPIVQTPFPPYVEKLPESLRAEMVRMLEWRPR